MSGFGVRQQCQKPNIIRQNISNTRTKLKIQNHRYNLLRHLQSLPNNPITPRTLLEVILMVVIDGDIRKVVDFEVSDVVLVDVVLVDLFGDDEEADVVFLL